MSWILRKVSLIKISFDLGEGIFEKLKLSLFQFRWLFHKYFDKVGGHLEFKLKNDGGDKVLTHSRQLKA